MMDNRHVGEAHKLTTTDEPELLPAGNFVSLPLTTSEGRGKRCQSRATETRYLGHNGPATVMEILYRWKELRRSDQQDEMTPLTS